MNHETTPSSAPSSGTNEPLGYNTFREGVCILVSAAMGYMIAVPISFGLPVWQARLLVAGFTALGVVVGIRRRRSVLFFYFTLISFLVISSLIAGSIFKAQ
jgi:hypothetical protein